MNLLATLLEANLHPRIPADRATDAAGKIRTASGALAETIKAVAPLRSEVRQYEQTLGSLARIGQVELGRFKKSLLSQGFSEPDVHTVIPDRETDNKTPTVK